MSTDYQPTVRPTGGQRIEGMRPMALRRERWGQVVAWAAWAGLGAIAVWLAWGGCQPAAVPAASEQGPVPPSAGRDRTGTAPALGHPPASPDDIWEFHQRMQSFVTGRPDLSAPPSAQRDREVREAVAAYFACAGLRAADARDLVVALNGEGLIMRFQLDDRRLERFLRGKRSLGKTAEQLGALSDGWFTMVEADDPADGVRRTTRMRHLVRYPFVRLDWWPPRRADLAGMAAYEGRLSRGRSQAHAGLAYYVLVDESKGLAYLLGW